jgi:hypothetical protein
MGSGYMVRDEKDQLRASLVVKRDFPLLFIQAYHLPCNHYHKSYGEWGDVVSDYVLATAMLDRLLHYSTTINIRGESYRLREKRKAGVFHDLTAKPAKGSSSPSRKTQEEGRGETNSRYDDL